MFLLKKNFYFPSADIEPDVTNFSILLSML